LVILLFSIALTQSRRGEYSVYLQPK